MTLITKNIFVLTTLLLFFSQQSYAEPTVTDKFTFKQHNVTLIQQDQTCRLEISSAKDKKIYPLTLTAPCYFLRNKEAKPQSQRYPDVKAEAVFIIAGNPLSKKERKRWNLSPDTVCGTQGQGLIFDGATFSVSPKTLNHMLLCRDKGADEKNYWGLSH
ncbi:hypothetical protein FJU30_17285 [Affinibrenneria salicis]|uniref:Uncharacterized protein n=1 Tax=Affinibrenneria salicis TaxID=2590031 RepID=A0A5J5FWA9_9GAMM|nr:hypothetical protein [Affinibrenneria salicis]KAA8998167.1 hypothetical protein FJU30_17285 [Affinibrenneria salicis]